MYRIKIIIFIMFINICGDIGLMAQSKKENEETEKSLKKSKAELIDIYPGTKSNEIINSYGNPDKVYEGNFIVFYYVLNQYTIYALHFDLSDRLYRLSLINGGTGEKFFIDGTETTLFIDNRNFTTKKIDREKIFYIPFGTLRSEVLRELGNPDEKGNQTLIYKKSEDEFIKLHFNNTGVLWKIDYYQNNSEWESVYDLRILEND